MASTAAIPDLDRLRPAGTKRSSKRDLIVNVFLKQEGHLSADDLVVLIKREDEPIEVWGGGQRRDFSYVDDAVEAFLLAAANEAAVGEVFNLGGPPPVTLQALAELMIEENGVGSGDQVYESNGVKLLVDPISVRYLGGAEVDFVDTITGGGFTIKNPNATSTCGCGSSFSA